MRRGIERSLSHLSNLIMKPKVLASAPCAKFPVFGEFFDCFYSLVLPEGSGFQRAVGGNIPKNLNLLVETAFKEKATHLFIVEDDSCFAPDSVERLLKHDKLVVAGLCRSRTAPFLPYIYHSMTEDGLLEYRNLLPQDSGLIKVAATGLGGILINMEVFKKLKKPYFHHFFEGDREWGQDIIFGRSLIEAGIEVYCDLDVIIGHATQCILGSKFKDGKWITTVKIGEALIELG